MNELEEVKRKIKDHAEEIRQKNARLIRDDGELNVEIANEIEEHLDELGTLRLKKKHLEQREQRRKAKQDNEKILREKYDVPEEISKILYKHAFEEGHAHGFAEIEDCYTTYLDIYEEIQNIK